MSSTFTRIPIGTFSSYQIKLSTPPYSSGSDGPYFLLSQMFCWPDTDRTRIEVKEGSWMVHALIKRVTGRRFAKALKVLLTVDVYGWRAFLLLLGGWRTELLALVGGELAGGECGTNATPLVTPWTTDRAPPGVSQPQIIPRQ